MACSAMAGRPALLAAPCNCVGGPAGGALLQPCPHTVARPPAVLFLRAAPADVAFGLAVSRARAGLGPPWPLGALGLPLRYNGAGSPRPSEHRARTLRSIRRGVL